MLSHGLKERKRPHHVGLEKWPGITERVVVVRLGGKMNDCVVLADEFIDQAVVGHVPDDELDSIGGEPLQRIAVACVGELVEHHDREVGAAHHVVHEIGADETGTPGHQE